MSKRFSVFSQQQQVGQVWRMKNRPRRAKIIASPRPAAALNWACAQFVRRTRRRHGQSPSLLQQQKKSLKVF